MHEFLRRLTAAAAVIGLAGTTMPLAALAVEPITETFTFTAAEQEFDVPEGVTSLHVVLVGGRGGNASEAGGHGARVEADLAVTPGSRLYVEVGGNGQDGGTTSTAGGFNGGGAGGFNGSIGAWTGAGGGASDLRTLPRLDGGTLASRVLVAAGGGGSGFGSGMNGGGAGQPGGGDEAGGGAGSESSGGSAGCFLGGTSTCFAPVGEDGSLGQGGAGSSGTTGGGGGGGGGHFGGGGGSQRDFGFNGGGGGGSSYTGSTTNPTVGTDTSGTPSITISYDGASPTSGTVSAEVTVPTSAACLELSTTSVSFGTLPLGAGGPASPEVVVSNCSGAPETILARGSDASGPGASWALTDSAATCADTLGIDAYRLGLPQSVGAGFVNLSTSNKTLESVASGASATYTPLIDTACPGSSGAGTTMTMQIVFMATE